MEVTIYFAWKSVMPDTRQYKQNGTVLEPSEAFIAVNVPLTPDYIFNHDKLVVSQLDSNSDLLDPILTPAGMRYCIDQLEAVLREPEPTKEEATEDWGEETTKDNTVSTSSDDDWADGAVFDEGDAGKADNELWENNEEDWK